MSRPPPPYDISSSFMAEQEQRASHWREVEDSGQSVTYDRQGKPLVQPIDLASWDGRPVPAINWLVDGWVEQGSVVLLSGHGGSGKSMLMQQLLTCACLGVPWLGMDVRQMRTVGLFCEDGEPKLVRRQERINAFYGCSFADVAGHVVMIGRPGMDSYLEAFDKHTNKGRRTPLWGEVRELVLRHKARLLVIDTAADVFDGQENFRQQVRGFMMTLTSLAQEMNGSVIITAHPSNEGKKTGTGLSGSTAWFNSVRAMAYLDKLPGVMEDDNTSTLRQLKFMKNNEGPPRAPLILDWKEGVLQPTGGLEVVRSAPLPPGQIESLQIQLVAYLVGLVGGGNKVQQATEYRDGLVCRFLRQPGNSRWSKAETIKAQERAIAQGEITVVQMGEYRSKWKPFLRGSGQRYPSEAPDSFPTLESVIS